MIKKASPHGFNGPASGLTLVEILVGVAVLSILLAIATPSMADLLERRRVIAASEEIAGLLNYSKAETNSANSMLMVHFTPDPTGAMSCAAVITTGLFDGKCKCYYPANNICPGNTYGSKLLRLYQLPSTYVRFRADATTWAGAPYRLRFSRDRTDVTTEGFRVDITGNSSRGYALRVEVNTAGRVTTCSPGGSIGGYPTCA